MEFVLTAELSSKPPQYHYRQLRCSRDSRMGGRRQGRRSRFNTHSRRLPIPRSIARRSHEAAVRREPCRFLNLDDDRLLKVFRQVAGLPAPGEDMGGWYDLTGFSLEHNDFHGFIAGHSFGQYLSALHGPMQSLDRKPTRAKINRLVKGYAETLDPKAKFFVDYRFPAYTYDKLSCGLD